MIQLLEQPLDVTAALLAVQNPDCGAAVVFTGSTRRWTHGRETVELAYDCYRALAEKELCELETAARQQWPIRECLIAHRLGIVPLGEISVIVAVAAPHREAAFSAARWLIDTLKDQVPIWKQEHWTDGSREWIHPEPTGAPHSNGSAENGQLNGRERGRIEMPQSGNRTEGADVN